MVDEYSYYEFSYAAHWVNGLLCKKFGPVFLFFQIWVVRNIGYLLSYHHHYYYYITLKCRTRLSGTITHTHFPSFLLASLLYSNSPHIPSIKSSTQRFSIMQRRRCFSTESQQEELPPKIKLEDIIITKACAKVRTYAGMGGWMEFL